MRKNSGLKHLYRYQVVLFLVLVYICEEGICDCNDCQVSGKSYACGNYECCCEGQWACCVNRNLTSIPKLPAKIKFLNISLNKIHSVSSETFENIIQIEKLFLQFNDITELANDSFANLLYLKELDLKGNINISKEQLSKSLYSIQKNLPFILHLDTCNLTAVTAEFFMGLQDSKLEYLSLRQNHFEEFNAASLQCLPNLKGLDLSNNIIKYFLGSNDKKQVGYMGLETLILSDNAFVHMPPSFCDNSSSYLYPELKHLDLSGNIITNPHRKSWSCLTKLETLNLSRNVLEFVKDNVFSDLISLQQLDISNMLRVTRQISSKAFNNSHLQYLYFQRNHIIFKPGSKTKYEKLFSLLPNLIYLNLGHNNLRRLDDKTINRMLAPLSKLEILDMEDTKLSAIPDQLLNNFRNLSQLILGKNEISWINASDFGYITTLRTLDLHRNLIQEMTSESFPTALQTSINEIDLSWNPFVCAPCTNMWFRNWIRENSTKFQPWLEYYRCYSPSNMKGKLFTDYNPTPGDCEDKRSLIPVYVTLGTLCAFILAVLVFGIAGYRGRWYIRYWIIKFKINWRRRREDPENEGLLQEHWVYDAYIIYYDDDVSFVRETLLPLIETQHGYKLFIRDRDQGLGAKVDTLVDAIYKSNLVIAVISPRFMKDQWCEFQLNVTLDMRIDMKKDNLLLVINEDIDKRLLSKAWCVLLTKTPTCEWCGRKNDIKRKLFEREILSKFQNKTSAPTQKGYASINSDAVY